MKISKEIFLISALAASFISQAAFSHGENKPGPHQGFIRMPGAFHVELVPAGNSEFKVYLLDISIKNPLTEDSDVKASIKDKETVTEGKCQPTKNHFTCKFPDKTNLKQGLIEIQATRAKQKGAPAQYPLPLSFSHANH